MSLHVSAKAAAPEAMPTSRKRFHQSFAVAVVVAILSLVKTAVTSVVASEVLIIGFQLSSAQRFGKGTQTFDGNVCLLRELAEGLNAADFKAAGRQPSPAIA